MSDDWGLPGWIGSLSSWQLWFAWRPVRVQSRKTHHGVENGSSVQVTVSVYHWTWLRLVARQHVRYAELPGRLAIYRYAPAHKAVTQ